MWNKPSIEELSQLPALYATEKVPAKEKTICMHFFFGDCDWYAVEFDGDDTFFGYAVLHGDMECAEWGYFTLSELADINIHGLEVDRDLFWEPTPAGAVTAIKEWL